MIKKKKTTQKKKKYLKFDFFMKLNYKMIVLTQNTNTNTSSNNYYCY